MKLKLRRVGGQTVSVTKMSMPRRPLVRLARVLHMGRTGGKSADSSAVAMLKQQHRMVSDLFQAMKDHPRRRAWLFDELLAALTAHAEIEEKVFYPALKRDQTEDLLTEAAEEHLGVKRVLADLIDHDPTERTYMARVKVLQSLVARHVDEEEKHILPMAARILTARELEELGQEMAEMEREFHGKRDAKIRTRLSKETDHPATI